MTEQRLLDEFLEMLRASRPADQEPPHKIRELIDSVVGSRLEGRVSELDLMRLGMAFLSVLFEIDEINRDTSVKQGVRDKRTRTYLQQVTGLPGSNEKGRYEIDALHWVLLQDRKGLDAKAAIEEIARTTNSTPKQVADRIGYFFKKRDLTPPVVVPQFRES